MPEYIEREARYIDANKFIDWLDIGHLRSPSKKCLSELNVKKMIELQPTADVAEVKHGEWEYHEDDEFNCWYECSECGNEPLRNKYNSLEFLSDYCPYCGAKMDGGNKNGE